MEIKTQINKNVLQEPDSWQICDDEPGTAKTGPRWTAPEEPAPAAQGSCATLQRARGEGFGRLGEKGAGGLVLGVGPVDAPISGPWAEHGEQCHERDRSRCSTVNGRHKKKS